MGLLAASMLYNSTIVRAIVLLMPFRQTSTLEMSARSALFIMLTALATFAVIWALSVLATKTTGVPDGFPPFTALPLASGVAGGFLGASAVYSLVKASAANPDRMFFFLAIAFLVLSFGLPLRLSFTKSPRFSGVTPAAQMTLALFHTIIAASAVTALTRIGEISR